MDNPTDRAIYALVLDLDEYHYPIARFEDRADADAMARLANEARADSEDWRRFYVSTETFLPPGARFTLDELKGMVDDHDDPDDPLWKDEVVHPPEIQAKPSPGQISMEESS